MENASSGGSLRRVAFVGDRAPNRQVYQNIWSPITPHEAMRRLQIGPLHLLHNCATYGVPEKVSSPKTQPQHPINPYGTTKSPSSMCWSDYAKAYQWGYAALRYFNASGASPDGTIGEETIENMLL